MKSQLRAVAALAPIEGSPRGFTSPRDALLRRVTRLAYGRCCLSGTALPHSAPHRTPLRRGSPGRTTFLRATLPTDVVPAARCGRLPLRQLAASSKTIPGRFRGKGPGYPLFTLLRTVASCPRPCSALVVPSKPADRTDRVRRPVLVGQSSPAGHRLARRAFVSAEQTLLLTSSQQTYITTTRPPPDRHRPNPSSPTPPSRTAGSRA